MAELLANSGDPDQMPQSDLGLHYLPSTLLWVSRLQWVKFCFYISFQTSNPKLIKLRWKSSLQVLLLSDNIATFKL